MDNVVLEEIGRLEVSVVIAWIVGIIGIIVIIGFVGLKIYRWMEKYRKGRNHIEEQQQVFAQLQKSDEEQKEQLKCIAFALQKILADRINQQVKNYYEIGYIPYDEFSTFQSNFHAYESVGGNGEMKEKYEKCITDLDCK